MSNKAHEKGKTFAFEVDVDTWMEGEKHKASVFIGREYFESDLYPSRDLALCEVKGWLEGIQVKVEATIHTIDKELDDGKNTI